MTTPTTDDTSSPPSWQVLAFTCLGVVIGAAYGLGLSSYNNLSTLTTWILGLLGACLFGAIAYRVGGSSEYSTFQKLLLIPLAPFAFLASLLGVLSFLILLAIMLPYFLFKQSRKERQFRSRMEAAGRYIDRTELLPLLEASQGTLIEESHGTGPFRIWYTPDDLLANGIPVSTTEEILDVLGGKISHLFNSRCLRQYLDPVDGTALVTNVRPKWVRSRAFRARFSHAKVVCLIYPPGPPQTTGDDPS